MSDLLKYENSFLKINHLDLKLVSGNLNFNRCPLVTIAIPTYKRTELLKKALDSALSQKKFSNYEVIVIDDENNPENETETQKLIKKYNDPKLLYYKYEGTGILGMAGAWNKCLELARGEWYSMLHDDDLLKENFLEEMMHVLNSNPNITFLKAQHDHIDERNFSNLNNKHRTRLVEEMFEGKLEKFSEIDYILLNPIGGPVGIIMKRENAIKLGGFKKSTYPAIDYAFFTKYCMEYDTHYYHKTLCSYRIAQNISLKNGVLMACAKIHYEMINDLKAKKFIRKVFFKKYPAYYYLKAAKHVKEFWGVEVTEEEINFLGNDKNLNIFWMGTYGVFKRLWKIKKLISSKYLD
ncbi:glycosyltransferase family 2 protein [uncultured Ilyobacter sp.]|uniref:glycosyltransferase family 2 protein n=1 Tax=uncultured Ilyobacter sp. TaxID=544433 RepID=UPI0029C01D7D|nr:glycosyltransferase family 2 protein [uncultured Ilyobacter sp.]